MISVKISTAFAIIGIFILGTISEAYHIMLMGVGVILLTVLLFFYGKYCAKYVSVQLKEKSKTMTIGQEIPMELLIENKGLLPVLNIKLTFLCRNGFIPYEEEKVIQVSVGANKTRIVEFKINSAHIGRIKMKISQGRLYDPIMLFKNNLNLGQKITVFMLPACQKETAIDLSNKNVFFDEGFSKEKAGYDSSEIFGIRDYREGDLPRQIHWKLSARTDKLVVKEFSLPLNNKFIIFAEFYAKSLTEEALYEMDNMLEEIFSLSTQIISQKIYHSIYWYDYKKGEVIKKGINNLDDMYIAMQEMLGMTLYDGTSLGKTYCPKGEGVFYFSPNQEDGAERRFCA